MISGAPDGTIPSSVVVCSWCQKQGDKLFTQRTSSGVRPFCSEVCFTQCRRASFKKNKVCDWCKHVRHTINYVDFQDGEQQLQFCSAKCLNQYKMKIFCKETQEHLKQMKDKSENNSPSSETDSPDQKILITPDLWMKESKKSEKKRESRDRNGFENHRETNKKIGIFVKDSKLNPEPLRKEHKKESKQTRVYTSTDDEEVTRHSNGLLDKLLHVNKQPNREKFKRDTHSPQSSTRNVSPDDRNMSPRAIDSVMFNGAAMASMPPWFHPQLYNAFAASMGQMGQFPPMFYPGMMPGMPGLIPSGQLFPDPRSHENNDISLPTPQPEVPKQNHVKTEDRRSPGVMRHSASRRAKLHGTPLVNHEPEVRQQMPPAHNNSFQFPPVTMIMPIPFPMPMPVPIPLPLPLKMEQIMEVFNKNKEKQAESDQKISPKERSIDESQVQRNLKSQYSINSHLSPKSRLDIRSCESNSSMSAGSERSCSVLSCPELTDTMSAHDLTIRKRTLTPKYDESLDLRKKRRPSVTMTPDSVDGAIDLSKDGILSRLKMSPGKENRENVESDNSKDGDNDSSIDGDTGIKVPRIHIITPKTEPPLSQQLPLPPAEHKYSNRRGRILDAPSVSKRTKSPSPERRTYVRSIPRDVMEAARRRCLRARIKTK